MHQHMDFPRHRFHAARNATCALGGQEADWSWFALQGLITVLNLSAILANALFMVVCVRVGVMHRNMRLMLCSISFCFAMEALAGLLYNFYFFHLGVFGFPSIPVQSLWCSVINAVMVPWDAATCLLMVGVGAERLIATKHRIPSGAVSPSVKVIFVLACSAAAFVTVNYVINLTDEGFCVCDGASLSNRYAMLLRISICAIVEAGTISLFGYVLVLSRSEADGLGINTAKYSLAKRFQIYEAYRSTEMLLPSAILHAVLYLSYLCLLIPVRDLRAERGLTVVQFNLSTIIFAFPSAHALAHPIICMRRHYYLRQRVTDMFSWFRLPCSGRQPMTAGSGDEKHHLNATPELSSSPSSLNCSFRSESGRVDFRIPPERHARILETFWEKKP